MEFFCYFFFFTGRFWNKSYQMISDFFAGIIDQKLGWVIMVSLRKEMSQLYLSSV